MRPALEAIKKLLYGEICCAEVGVFKGEHSYDILTNLPRIKKMYLVDSYEGVYEECKPISYNRLKPFLDNIDWIYKTSEEGSRLVEDNSLDFLYIDDDHTYYGAKISVENWFSKVREGGIIAGHDYSLLGKYPGVRQAVDELGEKHNLPVNVAIQYDPPNTINGRCGRDRNPHVCDWWIYK